MATDIMLTPDAAMRTALSGIPPVNFPENLRAALAAGRRHTAILREVIALRRGPGKVTPNEYFVFRLWDPALTLDQKRQFVGKQAQAPMHFACNDRAWFAVVDDKLLFHTTMQGAGLPVPEIIAIVHETRGTPNLTCLANAGELGAFLRDKAPYPLFGKPIDGMYSLGAFRADGYAAAEGELVLAVGGRQQLDGCAAEIVAYKPGYLPQRVLWPHPEIAGRFGERLCSVRLLVFLTPSGPQIARVVCKIPTGSNIADNFWRAGNMLGAVEIDTGLVRRVVRGTGIDQEVDACHPDTGAPIKGMGLPDWSQTADLAATAALTRHVSSPVMLRLGLKDV